MKAFLQSPVGLIEVVEDLGFISSVRFVDSSDDLRTGELNDVLRDALSQLTEYFEGKRIAFDLPIYQEGTAFQKKVWSYLSSIPYGETVSYKDEALAIGSPKGFRAVGSANGKNNIAIIVPCHRVVNENGKAGGYAYGVNVKLKLLELEAHYSKNNA